MYGWRAKIGLITPMSENAEHAFHIYATIHFIHKLIKEYI